MTANQKTHIVLEHDEVGSPTILALGDVGAAWKVYRQRLEELAIELCDVGQDVALYHETEELEQMLDDYRGNHSSAMNALFLMEREETVTIGEMQTIALAGERCYVEVGPLTVHIVRTDEGVVADIWGHEEDDEPLGSTWAEFNEAQAPAVAGD